MQRYDPLEAPDPDEWLALDEQERLDLVQEYHRRARIPLPNARCTRSCTQSSRRKSRARTKRPRGVRLNA